MLHVGPVGGKVQCPIWPLQLLPLSWRPCQYSSPSNSGCPVVSSLPVQALTMNRYKPHIAVVMAHLSKYFKIYFY